MNDPTLAIIDGSVSIPLGWILTSIGTLCLTVATLTTTFYQFLKSRLSAQDRILELQTTHITNQDKEIHTLREKVSELSQGCGVHGCYWRLTEKRIH